MAPKVSLPIVPRAAVTKLSFQSNIFARIPELPVVAPKFEHHDGKYVCDNVLGPLLERYGLEEKLGFCLVHRNFTIQPGEKLVEFNNVTLPWTVRSRVNKVGAGRSLVYETSWMQRDDGRWMPYEYTYTPDGSLDSKNIIQFNEEKYQNFLLEFVQALRDWRLEKIIGLRAYPGDYFQGGLEVCQDYCNIILLPGEFEIRPEWKTIDIMFFYAKKWKESNSRCICAWIPATIDPLSPPSQVVEAESI